MRGIDSIDRAHRGAGLLDSHEVVGEADDGVTPTISRARLLGVADVLDRRGRLTQRGGVHGQLEGVPGLPLRPGVPTSWPRGPRVS